jgi:hypothetical protein
MTLTCFQHLSRCSRYPCQDSQIRRGLDFETFPVLHSTLHGRPRHRDKESKSTNSEQPGKTLGIEELGTLHLGDTAVKTMSTDAGPSNFRMVFLVSNKPARTHCTRRESATNVPLTCSTDDRISVQSDMERNGTLESAREWRKS